MGGGGADALRDGGVRDDVIDNAELFKPQGDGGSVTADDAIIKVKSNVRDAQVYVDGRFIAPLQALISSRLRSPT